MRREEDRLQMYAAKKLFDTCKRTVWFHVPNGGKRSKATAARLRQMGVRPGVADFILLSATGLSLAIELKIPKEGRQSKNQEGFQAAWEANGGVYKIARMPEEFDFLVSLYALD